MSRTYGPLKMKFCPLLFAVLGYFVRNVLEGCQGRGTSPQRPPYPVMVPYWHANFASCEACQEKGPIKAIVPGEILREKKAIKRRKIKKREKRLTPRMEKTKELVREGYSIRKAMEIAGYSQNTINSRYRQYLEKLDLPELLRGLKPASAILNYKVIKVLDEEMDKENSRERIRAADVAVKMGKLHLGEDKAPPKIVFQFQTIDKQLIIGGDSGEQIDEDN